MHSLPAAAYLAAIVDSSDDAIVSKTLQGHVSLSVSPIKDEAGNIIGASKVARDITERIRIEAELREADRRKDEFLATLAHELRNPLAPLRSGVSRCW